MFEKIETVTGINNLSRSLEPFELSFAESLSMATDFAQLQVIAEGKERGGKESSVRCARSKFSYSSRGTAFGQEKKTAGVRKVYDADRRGAEIVLS